MTTGRKWENFKFASHVHECNHRLDEAVIDSQNICSLYKYQNIANSLSTKWLFIIVFVWCLYLSFLYLLLPLG